MKNQQGAPEALTDPSPDQLRTIARTARNSSGSASDDCGPLAYVLHGWRAATIAVRAQQAALVEAQQPATHVQNPAEIEHVAGDVSKNWAESNMSTQQPAPATQQAGWTCAPVEPTDAMVQAAHHIDLSYMPGQEGADRAAIYRAMLAAAPQPSSTAQAAESVTAPAGGADWQDISTAPKDGTRFVAVGQNYGLDSEAQHTCIAQWLAGCWVEVSDWNGASKLKYLTHWMPLPPLPCSAARTPADSGAAPAGGVVAMPSDDIDAVGLARYKVVPAHESMFHRFAVVAGDGKQQLYLGREIECENMARKFAGAFLDGAFYQANIAPTPATHAADSVLEDAARESEYRRGYRHGYEQRDAEVRGALA